MFWSQFIILSLPPDYQSISPLHSYTQKLKFMYNGKVSNLPRLRNAGKKENTLQPKKYQKKVII